MALLVLSPLLILVGAALVIWALGARVTSFTAGLIALAGIALALAVVAAAQLGLLPAVATTFTWGTLNGQPIVLRFVLAGLPGFFSLLVLLCGAITAGGLAWTLGRAARTFGLVFAGLLVLLAGSLLTITSDVALGALGGLGVAWLGSTIMQQATTAHNQEARFGGLGLLMLAIALLAFGATPQLVGEPITPGFWLAGCAVLIALAPRWAASASAPLLVRAPATALGLPVLGGYLLLRYATANAARWPAQTAFLVLLLGVGGLMIAAVNALVARRFGNAFSWQIVAQLALIALVFGTGQDAAPPMAAGLLAHTIVTGTALALAIGQLERATRTDSFAALPPLPQPLRRAGLAYGLAAASCAGIPPLLGYALRRVVLVLTQITAEHPWLPPVLLAASTLLALSFVPTLVAFFRRPAFRSPLATVGQRGGGWPLALMLGLLLGGLVPDQVWQLLLGDPSVTTITLPSPVALVATGLLGLLVLVLLGLINRALRHPRPAPTFIGGEVLDEEPGWTLPFTGLRTMLRPLVVPEQLPGRAAAQRMQQQRERLTELRQALERRYYLAVVVVSLISVLLLATQ